MCDEKKIKGRKGNGHKGKERGKGSGTLEKRSNGVYLARWTVDGKRFAQSTGTKDKREAEAKLAEFVAPFRLRNDAERLEAFTGKLSGVEARIKAYEDARPALALADGWSAFVRCPARPDSAGAARLAMGETCYNKFLKFMSERFPEVDEVRGVTKDQAQAYAVEGFVGMCNSTRNQAISYLRQIWKYLKEDSSARIVDNPWEGIKKRREVHTRRRELTVEELKAVCSSLKGEMRLLFAVGIYTGLRLGDCALLSWGEVDLVRRVISLVPRKTARKSGAAVCELIHPVLYGLLVEIPAAARSGYVMPECAAMYKAEKLSGRIKGIFKAAGIETATDGEDSKRKRALVSFHSLRHTFASMTLNAGTPIAVVQSMLGHSSPQMTQHYYHQSSAATAQAVAALPDVMSGGEVVEVASASAEVSARVRKVCAALDAMTEAERLEVMRHLSGAVAGVRPELSASVAAKSAAVAVSALPCSSAVEGSPQQERPADNGASESAAA